MSQALDCQALDQCAEVAIESQAIDEIGYASPMPHDADPPLVALLGGLEAAFVAEFDRRISETDMCALSLAHSRNVLRHLHEGPLRACQLVERSGVSKQAVSQQIAHLERNGYVVTGPDPTDQRARQVVATDKGSDAQRLVKQLFREIERDWADRVGDDSMGTLRGTLVQLLTDCGRGATCR